MLSGMSGVSDVSNIFLQKFRTKSSETFRLQQLFSNGASETILLNNSSEQFFSIGGLCFLVGCQKHTGSEPVCSPLFILFSNIRVLRQSLNADQ